MSNEEVVDDNHRRFVYSPAKEWEIVTANEQWEGTIHSTWTFDATATLNFTGSQIKVYITVPAGVGTSAVDFSLDGLNGERRSRTSTATALYNFEFFDSGSLNDGDHTIVMTNKGEDNDMDFQLDRVVIMRASSPPPGSSSIVMPPSTALPSTVPPTAPSPTEVVIVEKKASDTAIIAGSTVAGVVALAIIGALLLLYTHRKKRGRNSSGSEENPPLYRSNSGRVVAPFTTPATPPAAMKFDYNSHPSTTFVVNGVSRPSAPTSPAANDRVDEGESMSSDRSTLHIRSSALRLVSVTNIEDNHVHERPPSYIPDAVTR